jgi:hypothetical protein
MGEWCMPEALPFCFIIKFCSTAPISRSELVSRISIFVFVLFSVNKMVMCSVFTCLSASLSFQVIQPGYSPLWLGRSQSHHLVLNVIEI